MSFKTKFQKLIGASPDEKPIKFKANQPLQNKTQRQLERRGYDLQFIEHVQPHGGLTFDDDHGIAGDGYFKAITIYKYPSEAEVNWLLRVSNYENTIMSCDIQTANTEQIRRQADMALNELRDRAMNGRHATQMADASEEYRNLMEYMNRLTQGGEVAKMVLIRLYVYDSTIEGLEERVKNIRSDLNGNNYKSAVYLFDQAQQFKAITRSLDEQEKNFLAAKPQQMPALTLGGGVPFSHQELLDPRGIYLGQTSTQGPFFFDQFAKSKTRLSYNMMVLGKMGAGKSTLLKMLEEGAFKRNMYFRGIDKTKEYSYLIKKQGGVVVNLDGSEGMLNPLQVMASAVDPDTQKVDELNSFYQHLSKVTVLFMMINENSLSSTELQEFTSLLRQFYIEIGMLPEDFNNNKNWHITDLAPEDYPTMSDFARWINKRITKDWLMKENATSARTRTFEKIKISLKNICENYGQLFDGHSTIRDLAREKIVLFDTSTISSMSQNIFQAQLYSALSLIWNHALINGRRQNALLDAKKIRKEDIQYFQVILDECHNIVNAENIFAVDFIKNFEREMRKFNAGIIFATQSPEEMVPDKVESAALSSLKVVFELCQYKVIMAMDPSQLQKMRSLLGDSLTSSDYERIPNLSTGEAIFNTGSKERYNVTIIPNRRQLEDFKGGQ